MEFLSFLIAACLLVGALPAAESKALPRLRRLRDVGPGGSGVLGHLMSRMTKANEVPAVVPAETNEVMDGEDSEAKCKGMFCDKVRAFKEAMLAVIEAIRCNDEDGNEGGSEGPIISSEPSGSALSSYVGSNNAELNTIAPDDSELDDFAPIDVGLSSSSSSSSGFVWPDSDWSSWNDDVNWSWSSSSSSSFEPSPAPRTSPAPPISPDQPSEKPPISPDLPSEEAPISPEPSNEPFWKI